MGNLIRSVIYCSFVLLFSLTSAVARGPRKPEPGEYRSGTTQFGTLNALGRQQQLEIQRAREARLLGISPAPPPAAADVGEIAVIDDDGSLLLNANAFDLANRSVRFTPSGTGYQVAAGGAAFDSAAAAAGTALALGDDDTREVPLGFRFTFYGREYTSVFINSDGNLTLGAGDTEISARDLSRVMIGPPRIAPFFNDLNPADGGQLSYAAQSSRLVVTWSAVPECCAPPTQPVSTFQVSLLADGRIEFAYGSVLATISVVGISPGSFMGSPKIVDLSAAAGAESSSAPMAEVFTQETELSETAVARRFYASHDDTYDFFVIWLNFPLDLGGGAFAFERTIQNGVRGLGQGIFNFSADFGSGGRMSSLLMMGHLSNYPNDPKTAFLGENNTLSILGQETGHRWLTYFRYPFGNDPVSRILLGRDDDHWSFFFNSDASVMEGNAIRDDGDGTFTTTDAVKRYSAFDQYGIGLRGPEEVPPSFVVTNTFGDPGRSPRIGVRFSGTRQEVTMDQLIVANGRRLPTAPVSPKDFNLAFILVAGQNTPATSQQIQKVDLIRQQWEEFWTEATGGRSKITTRLLRAASFSGLPAAALPGTQVSVTLRAGSTSTSPRTFTLASSAPVIASVPASVTIPAGVREVEFRATAGSAGVARITAAADGHGTAEGALSVTALSGLQLAAVSGNGQVGAPSSTLSGPLVVEVRDSNGLSAMGVPLRFSAAGGASVTPPTATSDASGRAQATVTLGSAVGLYSITVAVVGADAVQATFNASALVPAQVPQGSAVNGASFTPAPAAVAAGSIISIFGTNLAAQALSASGLPLPTTLGNVTVRINDISAPLFMVSPRQINAQVPFEATGSTASLTVNNGLSTSTPISLALAPSAPGIFTVLASGSGPGAVLHNADGSLVSSTAPARGGEVLAIYCTGLGAVSPAGRTGRAAPGTPPATTAGSPQVSIGGRAAEVLFSGLAPGFVGLYQVNVRVPEGLAPGDRPLVINLGSASNTATLAVQ